MPNYFTLLWDRLFPPDPQTELDRISKLQRTAALRRDEHALNLDEAHRKGPGTDSDRLAHSRKRMLDAEVAYMNARQKWDNKESRQRSY